MKESEFQYHLLKRITEMFPGCVIMKNDANYIQGIPDWTILYKDKWATLECKKDKNARTRPNQQYYVKLMNSMSYSAIIYPENEEEILNELSRTFKS